MLTGTTNTPTDGNAGIYGLLAGIDLCEIMTAPQPTPPSDFLTSTPTVHIPAGGNDNAE